MRYLSKRKYQGLIRGSEVLRADGYGPKVYQGADGRIIKLFRVKRWWSSSMLYPYSVRFRLNSGRLKRKGFACATVGQVFYCHAVRRHGVIYRRVEGVPLDVLLHDTGRQAQDIYRRYAAFIAQLHAARVYFRSLHPGNVLLLPDGGFGLIDIADMRFPRLPLGIRQRRRNFGHLLRSVEFREVLQYHDAGDFIDAYLEATGLPSRKAAVLRTWLIDDFRQAAAASSG